jgi:hypothetical protein
MIWWSCRWGDTISPNCGHQWAYCSSHWPFMSLKNSGEWCRPGKTPDSSNRALWKSHQQSHLVANREDLGEGNYGFCLRNIFFHTPKVGFSCFTSPPKERVLLSFIALKNPSRPPGLNPRPLDPVSSQVTTTPPRWHVLHLVSSWLTGRCRVTCVFVKTCSILFGRFRMSWVRFRKAS